MSVVINPNINIQAVSFIQNSVNTGLFKANGKVGHGSFLDRTLVLRWRLVNFNTGKLIASGQRTKFIPAAGGSFLWSLLETLPIVERVRMELEVTTSTNSTVLDADNFSVFFIADPAFNQPNTGMVTTTFSNDFNLEAFR